MSDQTRLESLEQQARFFRLSGEMACMISSAGYFTQVNAAFERCLGHSAQALLAAPWTSLLHPEEVARLAEARAQSAGHATLIESTHRYRCGDGSYRWLEWRATPFEGEVAYAIAYDATENVRDAALLRSHQAGLRMMAGEVQEHAFLVLDAAGRIVTWNAGARRLNGYSEREIVGRHFSIFYGDDLAVARGPAEDPGRVVRDNGHGKEGWSIRKDGSRFWANVIISAIRGLDGTIQGFDTLTCDYTQRREAGLRQQSEHSALSTDIERSALVLREVHHRVKNNLQVISSMINMQARSMPNAAARRALEECGSRVRVLAGVHDRLRRSGGYGQMAFTEYGESLAKDIFRAEAAAGRGIELELQFDPVVIDSDRAICCGLIINELMSNALKHAFPEGRRGRVGVQFARTSSEEFMLRVWDDGIGLQGKAGLDAERPPAATTGTSIGMKLVTSLVEQLGGRLEIARDRGTSVCVTFSVPAPPPAGSSAGDDRT